MMYSVDQDQSVRPKTRRSHVRSRTGCVTCRNKRVRCDEQRPICNNCATTGQPCEFAAPSLPLRERRKEYLPGEQQPWAVVAKPKPAAPPKAFSSCASHPIEMPLHSLELFHYFHKVGNDDEIVPRDKRQNLLSSNMHHPDALRNTLLIAGFHYIVNVGQFNAFKPTLLLHKIETIRSVNKWLQHLEPGSYAMCVRQICTLCITECYLGNHKAAETHLNGLMKFMDIYCPVGMSRPVEPSISAELSMRYIILTYSFISACKSRVMVIPDDVGEATDSEEMVAMHDRWDVEAAGLPLKLRSMEILPWFFAPLSSVTGLRDVNAFPMIDCLLAMTEVSQLTVSANGVTPIQQLIWLEGAATRLILRAIQSHIETVPGKGDRTRREKVPIGMRSSWSGILIVAELYIHQVLGLWNLERLLEVKFHTHILTYLHWDLVRSESCLEGGSIAASDLWFWKAFVGAFSIVRHIENHRQSVLHTLKSQFFELLYKWSKATGITIWEGAREVLVDIAWPRSAFAHDSLAEVMWYESQVKSQRQKGDCA